MELKCLLVILLLHTTGTAVAVATEEPTPTSTLTPQAPAQEIGQPSAVVNPGNAPVPKQVIYINQCNVSDAQKATTTTRKPFSELDPPERRTRDDQKGIEFSTDVAIYRLRVMDIPLTCRQTGIHPKLYQSKPEASDDNAPPPNDDYYYYDDDHELAALVHDNNEAGSPLRKLMNRIPPPKPKMTPGNEPAAAAKVAPNPNSKQEHDLYILADGKLQVDNIYYEIDEYCIASFNGPTVKVFACDRVCAPPEFPCIQKCCEFGSTFDVAQGSCIKSKSSTEWKPTFYKEANSTENSTISNERPQFQVQMPAACLHGFDIWPFEFGDNVQLRGLQEYTRLHLLPNGSVRYLSRNRKWHTLNNRVGGTGVGTDDFCIESGELMPNLTQNQMVIRCSHPSYAQEIGTITLLIAVLYSIGSLFLTFITVLFILLWDDTKNVHTWAIFIEIIILFLHYVTLTSIYYLIINLETAFWILGTKTCAVLAVFNHFTYISIFAWMAILNYDFYITFNARNSGQDPTTVATSKLRFFVYFLFGFGVPALVIGFGLLMDHLYADPETGILVPEYGQYFACTMSRWAEGAYTYCPIGLLYIVSLVYMIRTHYLINETKNSANKILWRSSAEQERAGPACRVRLGKYWWYTMLFNVSIICGLTWIVQIISFIVFQLKSNAGDTTISAAGTSLIYVSVSDLVVGIQPIGICTIFLVQDRVWKQLIRKYGICRRFDQQVSKWTAGVGKSSKAVVAKKQGYNLANARYTERATQEEMISMVGCCKESGPTIDSVIPSNDYLDGSHKHDKDNGNVSPSTTVESISYKSFQDPDRETNV